MQEMIKLMTLSIAWVMLFSCGPTIQSTKPYAPEVKLDVPFESNLGNTCFSSSFAMVMRYWKKDVHVNDVLKVVGLPPFIGYEHSELDSWMRKNYALKILYLSNAKIEQVKTYLNEEYPVIVHQIFSLKDNTGHNRVVIGYSDRKGVFIVNDPSRLGPNYEIPYNDFKKLWSNITFYEQGPPNKLYLVLPVNKIH